MKCRVRSCSRKGVNGGSTRIASIIMPCPLLMDNKKCGHALIGVLAAIAVAGSPRHHLGHDRAFPGEQKPALIFKALQPARRDVVLDWGRGLVRWWFSRKPFSHLVVFPERIQWVRRCQTPMSVVLNWDSKFGK
jgi:hypothetical protein